MVTKESPVYLFLGQDIIGQDGLSRKQQVLENIKKTFLPPEIQDFNLDTLYAKEDKLIDFQKRFLCLPFKTEKRIIIIKDASDLKEDVREFILNYLKSPKHSIILILDINEFDPRDNFIKYLTRCARIYTFDKDIRPNAFALSQHIDSNRPDNALRILNQLLENGEKPEQILGALRYAWDKDSLYALDRKKRLRLLFNCDMEIKTGRIKPAFALEKLIISLSSLNSSKRFN